MHRAWQDAPHDAREDTRAPMTNSADLAAQRAETIAEGLRWREGHRDSSNMRGLDRIEITVVDGLSYEAHGPGGPPGEMRIGEPIERGGSGVGSSPLSHFLTGAGSCLLNQFVRIGIAERYPLIFLGALVRGEFRREAGGAFERITCTVRAEGSVSADVARHLVERAERLCYVHRTLVRAVEMTTVLIIDGNEAVRRVEGPA